MSNRSGATHFTWSNVAHITEVKVRRTYKEGLQPLSMKNIALISIGLATLSLALGYGLSSLWAWTPLLVIIGLLWLVGQRYDWAGWPSVGLICFVGAAAWGVWGGAAVGWLLGGTIAALVAWDLAHFSQRLKYGGQVENIAELKRTHLRRLLVVAGLGLLLGGVALSIQIELNFGWALLLGLLAILSLSWIISLTRDKSR
jgi:hypothetical protein